MQRTRVRPSVHVPSRYLFIFYILVRTILISFGLQNFYVVRHTILNPECLFTSSFEPFFFGKFKEDWFVRSVGSDPAFLVRFRPFA